MLSVQGTDLPKGLHSPTLWCLPEPAPDSFPPALSPHDRLVVPMQHQWSQRLSDLPKAVWAENKRTFTGVGEAMACPLPWLLHGCSCPLVLGWAVTALWSRAVRRCPGGVGHRSPAHSSLLLHPLRVQGAARDIPPQWPSLPGHSWSPPVAPQLSLSQPCT